MNNWNCKVYPDYLSQVSGNDIVFLPIVRVDGFVTTLEEIKPVETESKALDIAELHVPFIIKALVEREANK